MNNPNGRQKEEAKTNFVIEKIGSTLETMIGVQSLFRSAPMKEYTSFKAGGKADLLVIPKSTEELRLALKLIGETKIPCFVMGNGTNLIVRDGGFRGVIVKIGSDLAKIKIEGETIEAEAGALLSVVAAEALKAGLTGFEFASGIPGSLGGAVFMNAGAYGGEMKQVVTEVCVLSGDGQRERTLSVEAMDYGYRKSALMSSGELVLSAVLHLSGGDKTVIAKTMKELTAKRNEKTACLLSERRKLFQTAGRAFCRKADPGCRPYGRKSRRRMRFNAACRFSDQ